VPDNIVITDEAHRRQYDTLALKMRNALPKAATSGFTGTPLMTGEEKQEKSSAISSAFTTSGSPSRTGATVPLFYQNRIERMRSKWVH
jgi:type I restriction enzyme R subunit